MATVPVSAVLQAFDAGVSLGACIGAIVGIAASWLYTRWRAR